jgi:hypothetical protein
MRAGRPRSALALATLVVLAACNRTSMPQTERIELHRSAPQHLVLRNGSNRPASIEPFEETAPTLRLEPGSGATFDFVVATLADAEPVPGRPWRALAPGTEANVALIEPGGYLQESGPDLVLRVRFDDEAAQGRRFSLECGVDGWETAPAPQREHEVDLARPPLARVPVRICPEAR